MFHGREDLELLLEEGDDLLVALHGRLAGEDHFAVFGVEFGDRGVWVHGVAGGVVGLEPFEGLGVGLGGGGHFVMIVMKRYCLVRMSGIV